MTTYKKVCVFADFTTIGKERAAKHDKMETWGAEHNIKVLRGQPYIFEDTWCFDDEANLLAFTLQFGDLIQ